MRRFQPLDDIRWVGRLAKKRFGLKSLDGCPHDLTRFLHREHGLSTLRHLPGQIAEILECVVSNWTVLQGSAVLINGPFNHTPKHSLPTVRQLIPGPELPNDRL